MTTTTESKVLAFQTYALECSARGMDGGKFAPVLVVTKQLWPSRPRKIEVARGNYADEGSAILAAHRAGIEWVTNFG
jgi:hypothetical protein